MTLSDLLRPAVLVFLAVSFVVPSDTAGKVRTEARVDPAIVAWTPFTIAALILLPFAGREPGDLRGLLRWEVVLRAVLSVRPGRRSCCCIPS